MLRPASAQSVCGLPNSVRAFLANSFEGDRCGAQHSARTSIPFLHLSAYQKSQRLVCDLTAINAAKKQSR